MTGIWITGMGCISALGTTVADHLQPLQQGQTGIGPIQQLSTRHQGQLPVGAVRLDQDALRALLPSLPNSIQSRTSLLGLVAAHEAWQQAGAPHLGDGRTGLVVGTTVGGMDQTERFFAGRQGPISDALLQALPQHPCGAGTEQLADHLEIRGRIATISTACTAAANAILQGARWIRQGWVDRVLVGGMEALTRFTLNGFHSLQILAPSLCRPFDAHRTGLNLGEGAGFLMLESEASAAPERRLAELVGWGNSNDAYHPTAASPTGAGAYRAMQEALNQAALAPEAIDYINTHGTGTPNNDLSEGKALQRLFGKAIPPFGSTKSHTGHALGAAGGLEAVFSILALQHQTPFPQLNFQTPMPELPELIPIQPLEQRPLRHVLSNSLGFGGHATALIFKTAAA